MREIKFRFWDIGRKAMFPVESLRHKKYSWEKKYIAYDKEGIGGVVGEHIILEQYTGVKDKNGTEIYEGDIVEWRDSDSLLRTDHVTFGRGEFYLCNASYGIGHYTTPNNMEVVGTIHEAESEDKS